MVSSNDGQLPDRLEALVLAALCVAFAILFSLKLVFDPSPSSAINIVNGVVIAVFVAIAIWRVRKRGAPPVAKKPTAARVVGNKRPFAPAVVERSDPQMKEKEEVLRPLIGRECVYKENPIIFLVRVADVMTNSWGASLAFEVVPAPGFSSNSNGGFGASASWDALTAGSAIVAAQDVGWMLITSAVLVEKIKSIASETTEPALLMKRVHELLYRRPKPEPADIEALFESFKQKMNAGVEAIEQQRYPEAESILASALSDAESFPVSAPLDAFLSALATLHERQGHHTQAEPLLRRLLTLRENSTPDDPVKLAGVLNRLGLTLRWQKRYADAEPFYHRALAALETAAAPDNSEIASVLNNLGSVVAFQNRPAEAEAIFLRSLELLEAAGGRDNPALGGVLRGLGGAYLVQERNAEARAAYERSLTIEERALGPDHPNLAHTLNNLAGICMALGCRDDAIMMLRRAIDIREKALGPDHVLVGIAAQNLATFLYHEAEPQEVERLYIRSAAIFEKKLGPQNEQLADCLEQYALFLAKTDRTRADEVAARARASRPAVN